MKNVTMVVSIWASSLGSKTIKSSSFDEPADFYIYISKMAVEEILLNTFVTIIKLEKIGHSIVKAQVTA